MIAKYFIFDKTRQQCVVHPVNNKRFSTYMYMQCIDMSLTIRAFYKTLGKLIITNSEMRRALLFEGFFQLFNAILQPNHTTLSPSNSARRN